MKKVLPVLLAVVLMLSLSVSAFAANLTPSVNKTVVKAGEAVTVTVTLDKDIEKAISVSYKLRYDANLFTVDTENYVSLCDGGEVTVSEPKTDAKGTYVSISTMDTKSKGQTLKAGDFVAVTFTAKKDVTEQQATFTAEYENSMDTSYGPIAGMGAGPAATVTVTRDYSVTLPEGFNGAATVGHGEDYTFTAQQDPHYDYSFTGSTMGGSDVTVIDNGDGSFKVSKVTGNLVIVSNRTAKTYTVTVTGTGAADATAAATAAYATDYTFTLNKDANYDYTVAVTIGGQSCTPALAADGKTYTIPGTSITGNIVIHVTKTQKAPTTTAISFTGSGSGDVAGGKSQTATNGQDFTFTVDEKEGYTYTVKLGNETLTKADGRYTIPGAKLTGTALTVTVEKTEKLPEIMTTTISFTGSGSGDVAGDMSQTAENGEDFTFTVDEKEGYTYTVKLGNEILTKVNGQYTIPGARLTGAALTVTVEKTEKTPEITTTAIGFVGSGSGDVDGGKDQTATNGTDFTFTVNEKEGYTYTVKLDGETLTANADGSCTIPGAKITGTALTVTVEKTGKLPEITTTTIGFTGSGSGDVAGGTSQTAENGEDFTFTVDEKEGYTYTVKLGNEILTKANGKYTIPGAKLTGTALTVTVEKTAKLPEITTTTIGFVGSGSGDVAGGTSQTATNGTDFTFTVDEKEGYTYTVKLGNETLTKTNGQYTIPGAKLTGAALTVTVEKTAKTGEKPLPTPVGPKPEKPEKPSEPGTTEPTEPGTTEPTKPAHSFDDVPAGAYYEEAVAWAAEKGITEGTSATTFAPKALCTRAQVVTFLWRAAGCPEPQNAGSFADVMAGSYYAKAVAWAIENGITGGTGDGMFSPDAVCTRAQAVTFLYRASAAPAVDGSSSFSDVDADAYYMVAVRWAEQNGITGGIGGGLFGSDLDCTREQIVTFIFRMMAD